MRGGTGRTERDVDARRGNGTRGAQRAPGTAPCAPSPSRCTCPGRGSTADVSKRVKARYGIAENAPLLPIATGHVVPSPSARCASGGCARTGRVRGRGRSVAAESCARIAKETHPSACRLEASGSGGTVRGPSREWGGKARAAVGQRSVQRKSSRRRRVISNGGVAGRRKADEARRTVRARQVAVENVL